MAAPTLPRQASRADEQRIRKTTPEQETLYLSGLYERVTSSAAPAVHKYYVRSSERVVAVVTQGGAQAGTTYLHVDHLGSVDVVTDADGTVAARSVGAIPERGALRGAIPRARRAPWGDSPSAARSVGRFPSAARSVG